MSSRKIFIASFIHRGTVRKKKSRFLHYLAMYFIQIGEKLVDFLLYKQCLVLKASVQVEAYWTTNRMRGFRECMDESCLMSLSMTAEHPLSSIMSLFPEAVSKVCSVHP